MKVAAYYSLHYGVDYLAYSIKSIYDVVDEIFILYSSTPTFGTSTELTCPDKTSGLVQEAFLNDVDHKVRWFDGTWKNESDHRTQAHNLAKEMNYDILVMVDGDEIWDTEVLKEFIKDSYDNPVYELRIKMRHLWRSFNWICEDVNIQGRIFNLRESPKNPLTIRIAKAINNDYLWHFGMARTLRDIEYKCAIHGHISEWRSNDWFEKIFKAWKPGMNDVHPTCVDWWSPKAYNKDKMPIFMREHPYFNLKLII